MKHRGFAIVGLAAEILAAEPGTGLVPSFSPFTRRQFVVG